MYSLLALAVAALTACAIAHPPGVREAGSESLPIQLLRNGPQPLEPPNRKSIRDYLLPRYLSSQFMESAERDRIPYPRPQMPASDWLNEEIERINRMQERSPQFAAYKPELPRWQTHEPYQRAIFGPVGRYGTRSHVSSYFDLSLLPAKEPMAADTVPRTHANALNHLMETTNIDHDFEMDTLQERNIFAFTPFEPGYFQLIEEVNSSSDNPASDSPEGPHEGGGHEDLDEINPRRQIRQNPISRTKTLVADDLDKLRAGVGLEDGDSKDNLQHIRVLGSDFPTETIYAVGIAAGIGTAIILAILGFAFGWYTLSKRAKAAADVDYPAYGVTGPTMDTSGDRKLAHSAQMYHYQHQKQQIIAMERNSEEQRNGSVSDPESEEENEEGDYTVYECPGFATTGDMEVKNPLFNEEPTPATPGKVEVVKPQPKE